MPEVPDNKPEAKGLKSTLNLPQTTFPMKANLPQNEPARLAAWQQADLYGQIRAARKGAAKYILHDGPPYANGAIHLGHALNKCIKDFVVKTKTMAGFDSPYVPGWDCHGLPIEIKVDEQLGRKKLDMPAISVRRACREYAQKYVDLQKSQFERLGIFGRWNDPYLTMSFAYEASILETFYEFFEKEFVYKGLKPVYWCIHDKTALAEAEVEYEQHTSPSIYVRYKLTATNPGAPPMAALGHGWDLTNTYAIIWTTTPWTLPASQAIAFNPGMEYVALATPGATYIVAQALLSEVIVRCNLMSAASPTEPASQADIVAIFMGEHLERATFHHPFLDREILGVLAPYVTAEQGTGAVHTSPAHGVDDFYTGKRYELPEIQYIDNAGKQRHTADKYSNHTTQVYDDLTVFKSNPVIIELLREHGALLSATNFEHSYPHCWRCHNPVIVRATEQWFIGMETPMVAPDGTTASFRQRALDEIKKVVWDPAWGEERISNMIATRPDWCISRQRIWGVPIAVFLCDKCGSPLNEAAINKTIVELFKKESADAWYIHEASALLPAGTTCACGHTEFRKEMDILDVWFESGASWHAVLEAEPELSFPADLYTEGGDQHRGWFHSSLLNSVATRGIAPYKMVATSGWTLDEQGRPFSKSLGNGVDPVDIAKRLGGEVIRLWVASVDFREDVAASENLMQRVSDNYRKLRNTLRFLLGNLHDFTPATDAVAFPNQEPLDQYILARVAELDAKIRSAYEHFEFHRAYHALNEFVNTDLSALYLDVLKDRLYTFAPNHPARRSAQTALWRIAEALTRLIAPILSFTADETWALLPKVEGRESSVHLALFPDMKDIIPGSVKQLEEDWAKLLEVRTEVLAKLEKLRADKIIGKSLEATVNLFLGAHGQLEKYASALPELFNVSEVSFLTVTHTDPDYVGTLEVNRSRQPKCERCWRYVPDVGNEANYPTVCLRCAEALAAIHFPPYAAEGEKGAAE
ncbi:isoleucyl-tRNA synthetase [Granulicella aggregans]|uniref:Isoleucine--tRNA ligase n=1 Tax=Granulicella aggregans TaxID=474949 RepID=A0A7W7ZCX9_9BACT|nr:isoleucine--tRNA ligase [Granulicella aggregans]MBB5057517.1 isoleucyl-tRNA synthetase [Granulicella aggregans]